MKRIALFLALFPFLLNYSNTAYVAKKVNVTGNSCKVNFSMPETKLAYTHFLPDTTVDTTSNPTNPDTLIKS
jgi:hypothetical protein